jgi:hypothetical protein
VHSSYARMIANQIAIANLEGATEQMQLQQDNSILVVLNEKKEMNVVSFVRKRNLEKERHYEMK